MIPGRFDYYRPRSVDEAVALLARHGDEGRVIAGGHSLIPMMKLRLANPAHLIDLQAIDGLRGIEIAGGQIRLGALVTQHEMIASRALADACPLLREAALQIAEVLGRPASLVTSTAHPPADAHPVTVCPVLHGTYGLCTTDFPTGIRRTLEA